MSTTPPLRMSVIVPSVGRDAGLATLLAALDAQTLPRGRFEVLVALDGGAPAALDARLAAAGARVVRLTVRGGPGAARNAAARAATGDLLAFTEDDCAPAAGWLAHAAAAFEADPALEAAEGRTVKPGGRAVHRSEAGALRGLPTNLFVRRATFERLGGFAEDYFDAARGLYFREDSDFAFRLEEAGARVAHLPAAVVTHPEEHASPAAALRWAARHELDPLLHRRHPRLFRERIEVHRLGPFTLGRPVVRAAVLAVVASPLAVLAAIFGRPPIAAALLALAALGTAVVWAKWGFRPTHLPAAIAAPWVLVAALWRGRARAARLERHRLRR